MQIDQLRRAVPCATSLMDTNTLSAVFYPAIKIGSDREMILRDGEEPPQSFDDREQATAYARTKIAQMHHRLALEDGLPAPALTRAQFLAQVRDYRRDRPEIRQGQAVYNFMALHLPAHVPPYAGGQFDPFHDDQKVDDFITIFLGPEDEHAGE